MVTVLEASHGYLLVRWVERGKCHYGGQKWRLGTARRAGYCAISGRPITRGDPAWRPTGRPTPPNNASMIAPEAVSQVLQNTLPGVRLPALP
ncbi:DUF3331 domain-containing protein [Paraburkholderia sp. A3BS-1L]